MQSHYHRLGEKLYDGAETSSEAIGIDLPGGELERLLTDATQSSGVAVVISLSFGEATVTGQRRGTALIECFT